MSGLAAYGIANFGLNTASTVINNALSDAYGAKATQRNFQYGEAAASNADARTRRLYNDLQSPAALLKQYKEAGLSPSLIFGSSAIGGQTSQGAQGNGAAGISPTTYGIEPINLAQIELMQAQAEKEKAEAERIAGKNERGKAEIDNIVAHTKSEAVNAAYMEYKSARESIALGVDAATADTKVQNYVHETEILMHRVKSAKAKGIIDEATVNDIIAQIREDVKKTAAETLLKVAETKLAEANIKLTNKQVEDLINQIEIRTKDYELNKEKLKETVMQWGKENGFKDRELDLKLAEIIADFAGSGFDTFTKLYQLFGGKAPKVQPL